MSRGQCMSQTCLTLVLVSMLMPCPRHGLTLALIMWSMHVPDMSYTSSRSNGSSTISITIILSQFHNQAIHAILNSSTIQHIH
ncbi:hypothetical protein F383_24997 [Gossypium arboreum]|uniref:Secreted protein n=1 Tax=Gossypium arboreum TaxID=29729 RepID=A0A0B0P0Y5_GOSAR|nr:hypothetical protein F383_24997 [Gossypium arboreum]